jgi:ARG and Rhodanese-Phosphatase-superfamily-associated Protein domain
MYISVYSSVGQAVSPRSADTLLRGGCALVSAAIAAFSIALTGPVAAADTTADMKISGPHVKDNLAVYFIHGASKPGPVPLTLAEALRTKDVTVHETGRVQQLLIENTGDKEVFVQAGDIVKGGRQDRVLTISLLIPPRSGKIPIGSFCVEQGRWSKRTGESAQRFASAEASMPSRAAKIAILSTRQKRRVEPLRQQQLQRPLALQRVSPDPNRIRRQPTTGIRQQRLTQHPSRQQEVWRNVAEIQRKLSSNLSARVRSLKSSSSLQLSLEHQKLIEAREKMADALRAFGQKDKDIIGYAFAINGRINSAEIYPSNGLFTKMWPKLLKASVTEAIAEKTAKVAAVKAPDETKIKAFLDEAGKGDLDDMKLKSVGLSRERRETSKSLSLATRRLDGSYVHRSYLAQ